MLAQRIMKNVLAVGFVVIFQAWQACAATWTWNLATQWWMKDTAIVADPA